ncbi:MAG TPA: hypothetical protein PKW18_01640 [Candidatus Sumerlaeota bacterium]|nr:hypothetical protein [Candidatus Sumerlaeota bacterium]
MTPHKLARRSMRIPPRKGFYETVFFQIQLITQSDMSVENQERYERQTQKEIAACRVEERRRDSGKERVEPCFFWRKKECGIADISRAPSYNLRLTPDMFVEKNQKRFT